MNGRKDGQLLFSVQTVGHPVGGVELSPNASLEEKVASETSPGCTSCVSTSWSGLLLQGSPRRQLLLSVASSSCPVVRGAILSRKLDGLQSLFVCI